MMTLALAAAVMILPLLTASAAEPELPTLGEFRSQMRQVQAPAQATAQPAAVAAQPAACPAPALDGAVAGRGWFSSTYDVEINGKKIGTIAPDGDDFVFKDAAGKLVAKTSVENKSWGQISGRIAYVTDCAGNNIGRIQEEYDSAQSNFTVSDGQNTPLAGSGWSNALSISFKTAQGQTLAEVNEAGAGRFAVSLKDKAVDGRVIAIAGAMSVAAAYRRDSERRRAEMPIGPRGPMREPGQPGWNGFPR